MPKYADVDIIATPLPKSLTYSLPDRFSDELTYAPGGRVMVPLGNRVVWGIISKIHDKKPDFETKDILDFPDDYPLLSHNMMELARFVSRYYFTSMGLVLSLFVPKSGKQKMHIKCIDDASGEIFSGKALPELTPKQKELWDIIRQKKSVTRAYLAQKTSWSEITRAIRKLEELDLVEVEISFTGKGPRMIKYVEIPAEVKKRGIEAVLDDIPENAKKQRALLMSFITGKTKAIRLSELAKKYPRSSINTLCERGLLRETLQNPSFDYTGMVIQEKDKDFELTKEQQRAYYHITEPIEENRFDSFLLHGITGSGKTQVYIESAKRVLHLGKGVLILVPEISLTPQLFGRFRAQLGEDIALIHSAVPKATRRDQWYAIKNGRIRVAVGARSAIFAPVANLGLIIVDEEHDASFKQHSQAPHYNARDLALLRGKIENAVVVLGSATPSIESFFNARTGKYKLLNMPKRVGNFRLPRVKIVDMRLERRDRVKGSFSRPLVSRIKKALITGRKVILLLNRRGYSSYLQCNQCGHIPYCPDCSATLTYHIQGKKLLCHICDYEIPAPRECPNCGHAIITYRGRGTQKIEEEIRDTFGENVPIYRMDRDTTRKRGSMVDILEKFRKEKGAIMIGTQMVAKGLDFPDVTVVGVLNADIGLTLPDFRTEERIFQLLTQVAGRAGRSVYAGSVVIQTYRPESPSINFAVGQKFKPFFETELEKRRMWGYPPFKRIVLFVVSSEDANFALNQATVLAENLKTKFHEYTDDIQIMGPVPAPMEKIKTRYRFQILVKTVSVFDFLRYIYKLIPSGKDLRISVIPDPIDMM
ncbi:MAG: primosomal protein N' [Candidatus Zixiibacteriota bacterium]